MHETVATHDVEIDAQANQAAILDAPPDSSPASSPVPFWRLPRPWLALVVVILAGALLLWPR